LDADVLLHADNLNVFYGKAQALHDIDINVHDGEIVALVGRNGVGKSTLIKSICGLLPTRAGRRMLRGRDITSEPPYVTARLGIAYVPDNRQIFPNLTTEENLRLATIRARPGAWYLDRVYTLFPRLRERASFAGQVLSGGEQQMLAIGRALLLNPVLLLLDEPTEGLAPVVVDQLVDALRIIHAAGVAMLIVEQNFRMTEALASRQYVMDSGRIVWSGSTEEFGRQRAEVESLVFF